MVKDVEQRAIDAAKGVEADVKAGINKAVK